MLIVFGQINYTTHPAGLRREKEGKICFIQIVKLYFTIKENLKDRELITKTLMICLKVKDALSILERKCFHLGWESKT